MSLKHAADLVDALSQTGSNFFSGVPDSVLSDLSHVLNQRSDIHHVIAPNEGSAVGLGIGYFLGNRRPPVAYMQNSGLGNALNPLVSLCHQGVYGIPMLIIVGYRGRYPNQDEPQHRIQGPSSIPWLTASGLPAVEIDHHHEIVGTFLWALDRARETSSPFCVFVSPGLFDSTKSNALAASRLPSRGEIIEFFLKYFSDDSLYVAATGKTSRELAAASASEEAEKAFLCIGGMGHACSVALGLALSNQDKRVICIDGDGSFQMHMGAAALVGARSPHNLIHLLINNGVHDSVGGQPTANPALPYSKVAQDFGYASSKKVDSIGSLQEQLEKINGKAGPHFIEVRCNPGSKSDLGRPKRSPRERMELFLSHDS